MQNRGQIILGSFLLFFGLVILIGNLFDINVWAICWPAGLILLGVWLIIRPRLISPDSGITFRLLSDVRRRGNWQVADEEIWIFIGDIDLDLTTADIPAGETGIRIFGFVGDVDLQIPEAVGFSLAANALLTTAHLFGETRERFLTPIEYTSPGYEGVERKIRLQTTFLVGDLGVKRG